MNHLLENCSFDFSKAKETLKKGVLTAVMVSTLGNAMDANAYAYDIEKGSNEERYEQIESNIFDMDDLGIAQTMVNQFTTDKKGSELLGVMESRSDIKTPITYNDYASILKSVEGTESTVVLMRNPYSEDGLISMSTTSTTSKKVSSVIRDSVGAPSVAEILADSPIERYRGVLADYESEPVKRSNDEYKEASKKIVDLIVDYTGDEFVVGSKYKQSNHPYPEVGLGVALGTGSKPLANTSRYQGSDYFIQTQEGGKISIGNFNLDQGQLAPHVHANYAYASSNDLHADAAHEYLALGNEAYEVSELSESQKREVEGVATMAHELGHSFYDASLNREHNSVIMNGYETLAGFDKGKVTKIQDDWGMEGHTAPTHSRFIGEAVAEGVATMILGATATDEKWEYYKGSNTQIRKASYIEALHKATEISDKSGVIRPHVDVKDVKIKFDVQSLRSLKYDEVPFAVHEMAFVNPAMVKMMDQARDGKAPHLLDLPLDPVKMVVATSMLVAKSQEALQGITNNFDEIKVGEFQEFVDIGNEAAFEYAMSAEFKDLLNNLDTKASHDLDGKFTNEITMDVEESNEVMGFTAPDATRKLAEMLSEQHKDCEHEHAVRDLRVERGVSSGNKMKL